MRHDDDFRRALIAVADSEGWGTGTWDHRRGEHPDAEDLVAYGEGSLDADAADRLQEHLTTCRECAALAVELAAFPDAGDAAHAPGELEMKSAWRQLQERIRAEDGASAPAGPIPVRPPPAWRRPAVLQVAAAALMAVCLGLGAWNLRLGGRIESLTAPQPNVPVVALEAATTRNAEGGETVVERHGEFYVLLIYPALHRDVPTYSWRIVDSAGSEVLSGEGLRKKEYGDFTLRLHRDTLPAGSYAFRVFAGEGAEPVAEIPFRIGSR